MNCRLILPVVLSLCFCAAIAVAAAQPNGASLQITVNDAGGTPLPCRIHLKNEKGEPVRPPGQPFWNDHFVFSGRLAADLEPGTYRYEIERGPEHERKSGTVEIVGGKPAELNVALNRIANLRESGWYSADLHVHRPLADIELLLKAEDLDFAPVITWWNNNNLWKDRPKPDRVTRNFDGHRLYTVMAGEDEREGGALLYFGLDRPLDIAGSKRELPSPMQFVLQARERNKAVWIDIEKPFWWDVPVWLASGEMNSIGLANNHMCRSRMLEDEAWGKPRDNDRLPPPRGNGLWTQELYYHVLNCGLRIPPSAGSASGVLPNPVGYNRVYAHLEKPFTEDAWFESLSRGQCFVTNGPLLSVTANGELPGSTYQVNEKEPLTINLQIQLASLDRVPRLELIQNGQVTQTIDCSDKLPQSQSLKFTVNEPGWFLVRAIADVDRTFRFASTGPWYVETAESKNRISRRSAQFFLDWVDERIERVKKNVPNETDRQQILLWHDRARTWWTQRVSEANAD
jgi:hypothetical protein